jgi:aminopeptidase N
MSAFLARKAWGYHEDQLITTHPISGQVANTMVAQSIFDGITYSKGAATMKQLLLLIG